MILFANSTSVNQKPLQIPEESDKSWLGCRPVTRDADQCDPSHHLTSVMQFLTSTLTAPAWKVLLGLEGLNGLKNALCTGRRRGSPLVCLKMFSTNDE